MRTSKAELKTYNISSKPFMNLPNIIKQYKKCAYLFLILLPGIIYYIVFKYGPMYGVLIAFKDYKFRLGIFGSPWNNFESFRRLFISPSFWKVLKNTITISGYKLIFGFPAPIFLALLLNEVRHLRYKKLVQTISYLPHFLSWVILTGLIIQFLSPSQGPVNFIIDLLGFKKIFFLGDTRWFRSTLVVTSIWKEVGWGTIIYLATMSSINEELYEAAVIDGANRLQKVLHITIPSLMPVVTIMFIFSVGSIIGDDFDQIFNLYNPAVYDVADVVSTYTYRVGLEQMEYSFSTAVGLFQNFVAFVLIIITNTISKRFNEYGIW